jgi:hypothetical protein
MQRIAAADGRRYSSGTSGLAAQQGAIEDLVALLFGF